MKKQSSKDLLDEEAQACQTAVYRNTSLSLVRRGGAMQSMEARHVRGCNSASSSSSSTMWAEMARLPLKHLLTIIPCVCKPWMRTCFDPLCWQVLDLRDLMFIVSPRLLRVLLQRTQGHLREFIFPRMNLPDCLELLASSAPVLQKLHIPYSCASNEWAINAAPLMLGITDLDLSTINGVQLSHEALEAFGKHCRHIMYLRKNDDRFSYNKSNNLSKDDTEASAIAQNYPCLKHLELRNNRISTWGVRAILDGCPMLEHLDLTLCKMDMDEVFRECRTRLHVFLEPWYTDEVNNHEDDDNDDDDDDDIENDWCMCWGFPKMRHDCMSELDYFCGLCDCHVCRYKDHFDDFGDVEDEYGNEVENEEKEDEDEDEDEDEGEDDEIDDDIDN